MCRRSTQKPRRSARQHQHTITMCSRRRIPQRLVTRWCCALPCIGVTTAVMVTELPRLTASPSRHESNNLEAKAQRQHDGWGMVVGLLQRTGAKRFRT